MDVHRILKYGYENNGRIRKPKDKEKMSWDTTHWVFRNLENLVGYVVPKLYQKEN